MIGVAASTVSQMLSKGKIPKQFLKQVKDRGRMVTRINTDFVKYYNEKKVVDSGLYDRATAGADLEIEKKKAELAKLTLQAQKLQMENKVLEGRLVDRFALDETLTAQAAVFRQDLESLARSKSAEIVRIAGGTADKTPLVIDFMLKEIYKILERYARS
jgi:hypothetical protein